MSNQSSIDFLSQLSTQRRNEILRMYGTFNEFIRQYKLQECNYKFPPNFFVGANCITVSTNDLSVKEKSGYVNLVSALQSPPLRIGLNSYLDIDVLKGLLDELKLTDENSYRLLTAKYFSSENGRPVFTRKLHQEYGLSGDMRKALCVFKNIVGRNLNSLIVTFDHNLYGNPNYELFKKAKEEYLNDEAIFNPNYRIPGINYTNPLNSSNSAISSAANSKPTLEQVEDLIATKNIYELYDFLKTCTFLSINQIYKIINNIIKNNPEYAEDSVFSLEISTYGMIDRLLKYKIYTLDELARRYNDRNSVFGKIKRFRSFLLATNT